MADYLKNADYLCSMNNQSDHPHIDKFEGSFAADKMNYPIQKLNHDTLESTDFSNESPDSQASNSVSPTTHDYDDPVHEKRKQDARHKNVDVSYSGESDFGGDKTDYNRLKKQKGDVINTETGEPAAKRKAQNRRAQRAFRERKEKHLKDLEIKVCQLESAASVTSSENEFLKQQVERLQKELRTLKNAPASVISPLSHDNTSNISLLHDNPAPKPSLPERSFNFEFPFYSQTSPAANHPPRTLNDQDHNSPTVHSQVSPSSSSVSAASHASNTSSTGRSSNVSDSPGLSSITSTGDTPAAVNTDPSGKAKSDSHVSGLDSFCNELSKACVQPSGLWDETLDKLPEKEERESNEQPLADPMFNFNYVEDYREPLFDIEEDFTLPSMTTTENSLFDPLENIFGSGLEIPTTFAPEIPKKDSDIKYEQVPANTQEYIPCQAVWHRISSHPRFGDLDIDGLCSELRTKAKCSESGLVMSSKDLDKVLNKLN